MFKDPAAGHGGGGGGRIIGGPGRFRPPDPLDTPTMLGHLASSAALGGGAVGALHMTTDPLNQLDEGKALLQKQNRTPEEELRLKQIIYRYPELGEAR